MKKLELKEVTTFTEAIAGSLAGKSFKLTTKHEDLDIPFKWIWSQPSCENCGHVKQNMVTHVVSALGVYVPSEQQEGEEVCIWIALTKDNKIMFIPKTRRAELQDKLPQVENGIS